MYFRTTLFLDKLKKIFIYKKALQWTSISIFIRIWNPSFQFRHHTSIPVLNYNPRSRQHKFMNIWWCYLPVSHSTMRVYVCSLMSLSISHAEDARRCVGQVTFWDYLVDRLAPTSDGWTFIYHKLPYEMHRLWLWRII